ncbi:MAG: CAP domain-containing protein [Cyanobacteria bacterium P01_F01_bin.150]
MAQPTAYEQYMVELINWIRANPTAATQRYNGPLGNNTAIPKEPLAINLDLTDAAQGHSDDMLSRGFFSHTGSNGSSAIQRIEDTGFPLQTFRTPQNQLWSYGENISAKPLEDFNNPNADVTFQDIENHIYWAAAGGGWWPSTGHRDTILREGYKEIGVGIANGPYARYNNKSYSIATANFGTQDLDGIYNTQDLDQSFLTGVAFNDQVRDDDFYTPGEGLAGVNIRAIRQSDNQSFTTQTFGSGGYSLALDAGTYQVTFSGGRLANSVTETVQIGSQNVKLDLDTDERGIVTDPNPTPSPDPTPEPSPTPTLPEGSVGTDFNGDSKADILWQNTATNQVETWLMNGTQRQRTQSMGTLPKNFEVKAIGDFNGDGQDDLILQGPRGQVEAWFLNGTQRSSSETIFQYLYDTNQQVKGAADFNRDGQDDLLVHHATTGETEFWQMNGTDWQADVALPSPQSLDWAIAGTGDFNNDNNVDILWRNQATGQNQVWYLDGFARIGTTALPNVRDANQTIAGTGDFNQDGQTDIVWRDQSTGENSVWLMNGVQRTSTETLPSRTNLDWQTAASVGMASTPTPAPAPAPTPTPEPMPNPSPNPSGSVVPTDQFDQEVLRLVNQERTQRGLQPFTLSQKLDEAADLHSQDMADQGYFAHRGLNGSSVGDRIEDAGYTDWNRWGENIDWYRSTAEGVVQSWMNSPAHRDNILNRDYTHMGLGYAFDDDIQGDHRWTQVFAAGDSNPGQYVAETTGTTPTPAPMPTPEPDPTPTPAPKPIASNDGGNTIGEYGTLNLNHTWKTVALKENYKNPVVLVSDPTIRGGDPAAIRLRNVAANTFQIRLQEPNYKDGWHTTESTSYMVVEAGNWKLADGTRLSAGIHRGEILSNQGFNSINLNGFTKTPMVLSQVQTFNESDWLTTRTTQPSSRGVKLTMQKEEKLNRGTHAQEDIGWFAIDQGIASDGDTLLQGNMTSRSHRHTRSEVKFDASFDKTPSVIAKLGSFYGRDTATLRLDGITRDGFGVRVQEEQSLDSELLHTTESVSFLALEGQSGMLTGVDI